MKTFRNGDYVYTIDGLNVVRVGIAGLVRLVL